MSRFNFSIYISPRFFDLDVYRHVNNAVYATYCEEARVGYCSRLGIFQPGPRKAGFVIARAESEFLSPAVLGDELEVFIRAHDWGRARFMFSYLMTRRNGTGEVFRGRTTCVCWDLAKGRPAPLGEEERQAMIRFEGGTHG